MKKPNISERTKEIIRWYNDKTNWELRPPRFFIVAKKFGITKQRAQQIISKHKKAT